MADEVGERQQRCVTGDRVMLEGKVGQGVLHHFVPSCAVSQGRHDYTKRRMS
jgi:hypothetical protein